MAILDLIRGPASLGDDTNKVDVSVSEVKDGPSQIKTDYLTVTTPDEELLEMAREWKAQWLPVAKDIEKKADTATDYWLGKHYASAVYAGDSRPIQDNLIFEALETFLPEATKRNPEPTVQYKNGETDEYTKKIKDELVYQADIKHLRLLIKRGVRNWALKYMGVWKCALDPQTGEISTYVVNPSKLILDKDATVTVGGKTTSSYVGEYKDTTARKLAAMFPRQAAAIKASVQGKLGTKVTYIEWWYDDMCFYTYENLVLDKIKNPNFNWPTPTITVDEYGNPEVIEESGINHFLTPEYPYTFMSVFNVGDKPYDATSLIEQNLSLQDLINTTLRQIVKNIRRMNNGHAVSGDAVSKAQAQELADETSEGGVVWIPTGDPNKAIKEMNASSLPSDVYNMLNDYRMELRGVFGTIGLSAQGSLEDKTVRGKIITGNRDSSRVGGGIGEVIEQCADRIFNLWYQMVLVHTDMQAQEEKVVISVKEGSLIPRDDMTRANQAVDLATAGLIDPLTLFERLEFPDPAETLRRLIAWKTDPVSLLGGPAPIQETPYGASVPAQDEPVAPEAAEPQEEVPLSGLPA